MKEPALFILPFFYFLLLFNIAHHFNDLSLVFFKENLAKFFINTQSLKGD